MAEVNHACACKHSDHLDWKIHFNPNGCFDVNCKGSLTQIPSCLYGSDTGCQGQCGCPFVVICSKCKKGQMSKKGEGWCPDVRRNNNKIKNFDGRSQRCICKGCQRLKKRIYPDSMQDFSTYDYCSKFCATKDGVTL